MSTIIIHPSNIGLTFWDVTILDVLVKPMTCNALVLHYYSKKLVNITIEGVEKLHQANVRVLGATALK